MGINSCDSITAKRNIINTNYAGTGFTNDGEKISHGFCETNLEKGLILGASAFPLLSNKGKIYNFARSGWGNISAAYAQGAKNAYSTLRHPNCYWELEFLNGKIGKIEGILAKNTPKMPKFTGANATNLQNLFQKLVAAKNPAEYTKIVQENKNLYKTLSNIMRRDNPANWTKLTQMAKYNEIYGQTLKYMQNARTTLTNGGMLGKGRIASMHRMFANARLAENKWLRTAGKAGKQGAGLFTKGCAYMSKGVKTAMAASKTLRTVSRGVGKLGGWFAIGLSALCTVTDCISAYQVGKDKGEGWSNVGKQLLKSAGRMTCELGGAALCQWAGAAIGQTLIPIPVVGAAIGGIIGSFVGFWLGSTVADNVPGIDKSVAEEEMIKQKEEQKQLLCKAIDEDDWQTVAEYVQANKSPKVQVNEKGEPILDAEGNPQPILDANGNVQYEYQQVGMNSEEQKKFEAEIDKLQLWVEERYAAAVEAEQQEQDTNPTGYETGYSGYGVYGTGSTGYETGYSGYGVYGTGSTGYTTSNSAYGLYDTSSRGYETGYPSYGINGGTYRSASRYTFGNDTLGNNGIYDYENLSYDYDNGKLDYLNTYNPFMMNYSNNIFAQKYGQ